MINKLLGHINMFTYLSKFIHFWMEWPFNLQ